MWTVVQQRCRRPKAISRELVALVRAAQLSPGEWSAALGDGGSLSSDLPSILHPMAHARREAFDVRARVPEPGYRVDQATRRSRVVSPACPIMSVQALTWDKSIWEQSDNAVVPQVQAEAVLRPLPNPGSALEFGLRCRTFGARCPLLHRRRLARQRLRRSGRPA
jgi:hypothetical protein